jgi:hypothetical protein
VTCSGSQRRSVSLPQCDPVCRYISLQVRLVSMVVSFIVCRSSRLMRRVDASLPRSRAPSRAFRAVRVTSFAHGSYASLIMQLISRCARRSEGLAILVQDQNCAATCFCRNALGVRRNLPSKQFAVMRMRRSHQYLRTMSPHSQQAHHQKQRL